MMTLTDVTPPRSRQEDALYILVQNRACGFLAIKDWLAFRMCSAWISAALDENRVWEYCLSQHRGKNHKKAPLAFEARAVHCAGFRGDGHRQIHTRFSGDWYHWLVMAYPIRQRSMLQQWADYWRGNPVRSHYFFFMGPDYRLHNLPNLFYWEVYISRNLLVSPIDFSVSVGMASREDIQYLYSSGMHVGFTSRSMGYKHNGTICCDDAAQNGKKEPYSIGDVIGCGIDLERHLLFWTKNGVLQYKTPRFLTSSPLLPVVQASHKLFVTMNYGEKPFRFDLSSLVV